MKKRRGQGGAPRKAPGGLTRVLFVRLDESLDDKLELHVERRRAKEPGLSKSDVVRDILQEHLEP